MTPDLKERLRRLATLGDMQPWEFAWGEPISEIAAAALARIEELEGASEACSNCRFWNQDYGLPTCRRHAPVKNSSLGAAAWPVTEAANWCGDWELRHEPT